MLKYGILCVVLIAVLCAAGCTSQPAAVTTAPAPAPGSSQAAPQAQAATGPTASVLIEEKAFNPNILNVAVGTTVVWTNQDTVDHRIVHRPLNGETELFHSDRLTPGQSYSYTFTTAGRYEYFDPQYARGRNPLIIVA